MASNLDNLGIFLKSHIARKWSNTLCTNPLESDAKEFAAEVATDLGCKMEEFQKTKRITKSAKDHRDLILYLLWETGRYKGRKIGDLFGLGYSAVSRRAAMTREN